MKAPIRRSRHQEPEDGLAPPRDLAVSGAVPSSGETAKHERKEAQSRRSGVFGEIGGAENPRRRDHRVPVPPVPVPQLHLVGGIEHERRFHRALPHGQAVFLPLIAYRRASSSKARPGSMRSTSRSGSPRRPGTRTATRCAGFPGTRSASARRLQKGGASGMAQPIRVLVQHPGTAMEKAIKFIEMAVKKRKMLRYRAWGVKEKAR